MVFAESVSVVYVMDPPAVGSRFVDALNAIEIAFTGTTDRQKAKKKLTVQTNQYDGAASWALGKKGACSESANVLVTLSGAKIVPGDTIALLPSSINICSGLIVGSNECTVPVDTPLSQPVDVI